MNILGIVAEYNPFHMGHEYQLKKARELSGCDGIAVVMSGNFVQRGEPAIIEKYKRAEVAVLGGADIVIELPMPFSNQSAELFSFAAINELKKLFISSLSFGCENSDINTLKEIAKMQLNNPMFQKMIKDELDNGISYPKAFSNALEKNFNREFNETISFPNNVLAIEYIKSATNLNLNLEYYPIKRIGKNHNDLALSGSYDSATAIRKNILSGLMDETTSLNEECKTALKEFYKEYGKFNTLNNYLDYLYYKILDLGTEGLKDIYEISEGLNNKIYSNVFLHNNVDDFIMSIKSKRYTYSKIRRSFLNILLNIEKNQIKEFRQSQNSYVKVLAFNDNGRKIILNARQKGTVVIIRYSDYKKYGVDVENSSLFDLSQKATNIYYLPFQNKMINNEYKQNAIYVSSHKK